MERNKMEIIVLVIQVIASYFIVVTVHELGHIVVGIISGFRFELFVLGPIGLKRNENGNLIFYIEKNKALWGGCAATVPIKEDKENINKFANLLIGGPLISLIFGILLIILFINFRVTFYLVLGAMSLGISFATLIPMRAGCFYTDGGRWLRIKRKGYASKVEIVLIKFTQSYYINNDYSKLCLKDIQILTFDEDKRNKYLGHYYAYHYYKDNFDSDGMESEKLAIKALEPSVPKNFVKLLALE